MSNRMVKWVIFVILNSCVGNPVSKNHDTTDSPVISSNSKIVEDELEIVDSEYSYEAYRMTGYGDDRYVAVKLEILSGLPQKIYLVDLATSEPWEKISEVVESTLNCSSSTNCHGEIAGQEFVLNWANNAKVVAQLAIYREGDEVRTTHVYNRVLSAMGERLELSQTAIEQRYFSESSVGDFLVGGQTDSLTVEVDQVFVVSFSNLSPMPVARELQIEAVDDTGNLVEDVLANVQALDSDEGTIFVPTAHQLTAGRTISYPLFFVPEAIIQRVNKIIGYVEGIKIGEVDLRLSAASRTLTVEMTGDASRYTFSPAPASGNTRQHLRLKELTATSVVTGNELNSDRYQYSVDAPDSYSIVSDDFPCVAPNIVYGWLQATNGKEIPPEKRQLYRVDCR